jgi:hypothetical protein
MLPVMEMGLDKIEPFLRIIVIAMIFQPFL